jgi:hypothetical protein
MTVTEDDGRFVFKGLPAGRFVIVGTKPTYLPTAYGVIKPMRPGSTPTGTAIALADGQQFTDATLRITRGCVVTGVVRGTDGQPVRGATIALAYATRAPMTGDRILSSLQANGTVTDSRGAYRLYGVPPGEYLASASIGSTFDLQSNDFEVTTDADVQRILDQTTGRLVAPDANRPLLRRPSYGYARVFYPSTTALAAATPIVLAAGEERDGIDFHVQLVPQSRVSGVVTGPDGKPAAGMPVRLTTPSPSTAGPFLAYLSAFTDPQGQFQIRAVAAGEYVLEVRPSPGRGVGIAPSMNWARMAVSVASGTDVTVNVALQPSRTVSGRIALPQSVAAPDLARARVSIINRDGSGSTGTVSADGQFSVAGVLPDAYRFSVSLPASAAGAPPWFVKSASIGGRDAYDTFVDIADDIATASIVLTDRVSEVSGAITDGVGRPAPEYVIIVFPSNPSLWTWQSRRIQQARPSHDGKFAFRNLPAGDYLLGAVTDVEQNEWFEPKFLTELVGASVKLTLADGEKKTQDIRLR